MESASEKIYCTAPADGAEAHEPSGAAVGAEPTGTTFFSYLSKRLIGFQRSN